MSYAVLADLVDRYGEEEVVHLTDRVGDRMIDATVVERALADAGAVIDGHLAGRYALPLSQTPAILTGYACDLARERLYKDAAPEAVIKRADDARKFLALLAKGQITLGLAADLDAPASGIAYTTPGRVFGADDPV